MPLIHNVMNTDLVIGISDQATDGLNAVFNTEVGRAYLARRLGLPDAIAHAFAHFGLSSIANILGAIKMAKHAGLGPDDVIVTVATDGHEMYRSELARYLQRRHNLGDMTSELAAELVGRHLSGADTEHVLEPPSASASASSTSATSPGSSSRASRWRISSAASRRTSGRACMRWCRNGTR